MGLGKHLVTMQCFGTAESHVAAARPVSWSWVQVRPKARVVVMGPPKALMWLFANT